MFPRGSFWDEIWALRVGGTSVGQLRADWVEILADKTCSREVRPAHSRASGLGILVERCAGLKLAARILLFNPATPPCFAWCRRI
jgi:hypothetical protein